MRQCTTEDCNKKVQARDLCYQHYQQKRRDKSMVIGCRNWRDHYQRFKDKYVVENGCWNWSSTRTKEGYGTFNLNGKNVLAHRYSYEKAVGLIPEGLEIDHKCRNKSCVNPMHLEPVTHLENMRRHFQNIVFEL